MKIDTQRISTNGELLTYREEIKRFKVLSDLSASGQYRFPDPVTVRMMVTPEGDMFKVKGQVATTVHLACSRCLVDYPLDLSKSVSLLFSKEIPEDVHRGDDEVELTAEKIGLIYFQGEEIDLREAIEEQVVMALPYKPLCRPDCRGLCPQCGADLNTESCKCKKENAMSPFAVLSGRQWPDGKKDT